MIGGGVMGWTLARRSRVLTRVWCQDKTPVDEAETADTVATAPVQISEAPVTNKLADDADSLEKQTAAVKRTRGPIDENTAAAASVLLVAEAVASLVDRVDTSATASELVVHQEMPAPPSAEPDEAPQLKHEDAEPTDTEPDIERADEEMLVGKVDEPGLGEEVVVPQFAESEPAFQAELSATQSTDAEPAFTDELPADASAEAEPAFWEQPPPIYSAKSEPATEHGQSTVRLDDYDQPVFQDEEEANYYAEPESAPQNDEAEEEGEETSFAQHAEILRPVAPSSMDEPIELSDTEDEEPEEEEPEEEEPEDEEPDHSEASESMLDEGEDVSESEPFDAEFEGSSTMLDSRGFGVPTLENLVPAPAAERSESNEWAMEDTQNQDEEHKIGEETRLRSQTNAVIECLTSDDEEEESVQGAATVITASAIREHEQLVQVVTASESAHLQPAIGDQQIEDAAEAESSLKSAPASDKNPPSSAIHEAADIAEFKHGKDSINVLQGGAEEVVPSSVTASPVRQAPPMIQADEYKDDRTGDEDEETKQGVISPSPVPEAPASPPPDQVTASTSFAARILDGPSTTQLLTSIAVHTGQSSTIASGNSLAELRVNTALPPRPEKRSWGASFGLTVTPAPTPTAASSLLLSAASPAHATSPLNSWFLSKGHANFMQRVAFPPRPTAADRLHRHRSLSPRRQLPVSSTGSSSTSTSTSTASLAAQNQQIARVLESAAKAYTSPGDDESADTSDSNAFLEELARQSSWRSWYGSVDQTNLLDPPLQHVPAEVRSTFDAESAAGDDDEDDAAARELSQRPTTSGNIALLEAEIRYACVVSS